MSKMIFLDSVSIADIKAWKEKITCTGITTNQIHFSKEKNINFKKTILALCNLLKVPVSVELTTHSSVKEMLKEANLYASWSKHIVIKVPLTTDGMGLVVIKKLSSLHIKTNATLMVSFEQMILAANAGASYISILLNRSKDAGYDGLEIIRRSRKFIDLGNYKSKIIAGSIRQVRDVGDSFEAGCDIVTIPPKILSEMLNEPKTQSTIEEFDAAWEQFKKTQNKGI